MSSSLWPLRITAAVELVSLIILLINLATVHWPAVASLVGPTHGCAYLFVIILAASRREATTSIRATAMLPGIGGLVVLRRLAAALQHSERRTARSAGKSSRRQAERSKARGFGTIAAARNSQSFDELDGRGQDRGTRCERT